MLCIVAIYLSLRPSHYNKERNRRVTGVGGCGIRFLGRRDKVLVVYGRGREDGRVRVCLKARLRAFGSGIFYVCILFILISVDPAICSLCERNHVFAPLFIAASHSSMFRSSWLVHSWPPSPPSHNPRREGSRPRINDIDNCTPQNQRTTYTQTWPKKTKKEKGEKSTTHKPVSNSRLPRGIRRYRPPWPTLCNSSR